MFQKSSKKFQHFSKKNQKNSKNSKKNEIFFDFFFSFNLWPALFGGVLGYPNSFPETDLHSNCKTKRRKIGHWRDAGSGRRVGWLQRVVSTVSQGKTGFAGIIL